MATDERRREREQRLLTQDEQIAQALQQSLASGELRHAPSYGKPMDLDDAFARTPQELRLGLKMLKDAGVLPAEVELMQRIARLQAEAEASTEPATQRRLLQQVAEQRQHLALRLEQLRRDGRW